MPAKISTTAPASAPATPPPPPAPPGVRRRRAHTANVWADLLTALGQVFGEPMTASLHNAVADLVVEIVGQTRMQWEHPAVWRAAMPIVQARLERLSQRAAREQAREQERCVVRLDAFRSGSGLPRCGGAG